jgi:hypothetical protein
MHPAIEAPSRRDEVEKAVNELISDAFVPFGIKDGNLSFHSEKINDIEKERSEIPLRSMETRRILNESLREAYSPLPSVRLHGTHAVTSGLKAQSGSSVNSLAGERETIQTIVEFVDPSDYETVRTRLIDESRHRSSQHSIYLLGRRVPEIDEKVAEIYRCQEICTRHRNEPDQEVKEYCSAQTDRAAKLSTELQHIIKRCLSRGSLIFRGQPTSVDSLDQDVIEASKKHLGDVAEQVFDRYSEAPVRAETALAEKFLKAGNLSAVTSTIDPLNLVQVVGGTPSIKTDYKALGSIRDYIERSGTVEGKRLIDYFTGAPFGWSQDTLRYILAALLAAREIKLKVSGREVTSIGQHAIDALKTNNAFKSVGVSLRVDKPSIDVLARASQRLTEIIGESILPDEKDICKAAQKNFPQIQVQLAPLAEKLSTLYLPGADDVRSLNKDIADILFTDASDAPQRFGGEESTLYETLKWAKEVDRALGQGLEQTIRDLQNHRGEIKALPDAGVTGQLRKDVAEEIERLEEYLGKEKFYQKVSDLNTILTNLKASTRDAAIKMSENQGNLIKESEEDLTRLPEWSELTQEEQSNVMAQLENLQIEASHDLEGLKKLNSQQLVIHSQLSEMKNNISRQGQERIKKRLEYAKEKAKKEGKKKLSRSLQFPASISNADTIDDLIRQLQELKKELSIYSEIDIKIKIEDL